ncbi:MAG: hypothetical protein ACYS74_23185, partial [Planctomycetota bacterium]
MAQEQIKYRAYHTLYVCGMLLLAFAAIARGEAAFDAIEGTYYYDPLNRITLQGDQVTWQYVTDL